MKEDQCAVIRDLVKESRIRESGKQYWYPEISEKIKNLLLMYYDRSMPLEDVCAFLDTTIRGNGRFGMVFTRTGIYFARYLSKTVYYINYADIDRIEVLPDRKGRRDSTAAAMTVVLKDGASVDIGTSDYRKLRLKKLLLRLREEYFSNEEVPEIRASGLVPRVVLPDKQRRECLAVIRRTEAEAALAGAGLAQIPLSDTLLITPLQIKMVIQLGRVFGIQVTESMARGPERSGSVHRGARHLAGGSRLAPGARKPDQCFHSRRDDRSPRKRGGVPFLPETGAYEGSQFPPGEDKCGECTRERHPAPVL